MKYWGPSYIPFADKQTEDKKTLKLPLVAENNNYYYSSRIWMMLSFAEALSWTCFLHLTLCYIFPAYSSRVSSCRFWCICNNSRKPHTQGSAITTASTKSGVLDLHCFRHSLYLWLMLTPKFFSFSIEVYVLKLKTKALPVFTGVVWHSSIPQSLCNGTEMQPDALQ